MIVLAPANVDQEEYLSLVFCLFLPSRFHRAPNVLAISEVMVKDGVKDRVKGESRDADLGLSLRIELDVKTGRSFLCLFKSTIGHSWAFSADYSTVIM